MAMTIAEKIIARHAGRESVKAGEIVWTKVDMVMSHDLGMPAVLTELEKLGSPSAFDTNGVCIVFEHVVPSHSIQHANTSEKVRQWARMQNLQHFYDMGRHGIVHVFLPEKGLARPGQLIVGSDSHTCTLGVVGAFATGVGSTDAAVAIALGETWLRVPATIRIHLEGQLAPWVSTKDVFLTLLASLGADGALYKALEFAGPAVANLSMDARATLCNMAIEAGAKTGIISPDEVTRAWLAERPFLQGDNDQTDWYLRSDDDANFEREIRFDLTSVEPMISVPPAPDNVRPVSELTDIKVNQVFLGTCTNGRLEDLRVAASILKGHKIDDSTRMLVVPASQDVMLQAMREGIAEVFLEAGAIIGTPGCGPCHGLHMGPLADGDVGLYTANRNFPGRQGGPGSKVYLASPAVAAATAITGHIASPSMVAHL